MEIVSHILVSVMFGLVGVYFGIILWENRARAKEDEGCRIMDIRWSRAASAYLKELAEWRGTSEVRALLEGMTLLHYCEEQKRVGRNVLVVNVNVEDGPYAEILNNSKFAGEADHAKTEEGEAGKSETQSGQ